MTTRPAFREGRPAKAHIQRFPSLLLLFARCSRFVTPIQALSGTSYIAPQRMTLMAAAPRANCEKTADQSVRPRKIVDLFMASGTTIVSPGLITWRLNLS